LLLQGLDNVYCRWPQHLRKAVQLDHLLWLPVVKLTVQTRLIPTSAEIQLLRVTLAGLKKEFRILNELPSLVAILDSSFFFSQQWVWLSALLSLQVGYSIADYFGRKMLLLLLCERQCFNVACFGRPEKHAEHFAVADVALVWLVCLQLPLRRPWDFQVVAQFPAQDKRECAWGLLIEPLLFLNFLRFKCLNHVFLTRKVKLEVRLIGGLQLIFNLGSGFVGDAVAAQMETREPLCIFEGTDNFKDNRGNQPAMTQVQVDQLAVLFEHGCDAVHNPLLFCIEKCLFVNYVLP
jgi:hypothetical protein